MTAPIDVETVDTTDQAPSQPAKQMALAPRAEQALAAAPAPAPGPQVTSAQAKVEAIAALTMKAYERAATLVLTPDEVKALQADFPDEAFKPGAAGKEHLIYIEHAYLRDRLNQVLGLAQWAIVPRSRWAEDFMTKGYRDKPATAASRVYVEAMLIIRGAFVAEAVGDMVYYKNNEGQNYGDAVEGAKTAALRRCCKELGVGLQAWKKDWCEGWWQRRNAAARRPSTPPADPAARPRPAAAPAAAPAATAKPATTEAGGPKLKTATQGTRDWMVKELADFGTLAVEYFQKLQNPTPLAPWETSLEDLGWEWVPITQTQMKLLKAAITDFGNGGEAVRAYPANPVDPALDGALKQKKAAKKPKTEPPEKSTTKAVQAAKDRDPEWFWDVICPIPVKGMKKAEYDRKPDTIGSLYKQIHEAGQDEAEAARKRLFGFANNWKPEPREWNGRIIQPTEADKVFREALDAFLEWHEKHGNDTQPEKEPEVPGTEAYKEEDDVPF